MANLIGLKNSKPVFQRFCFSRLKYCPKMVEKDAALDRASPRFVTRQGEKEKEVPRRK